MIRCILALMLLLIPINHGMYANAQNYTTSIRTYKNLNNAYVTDLNLALRLSKETKQKLVLIFGADWCGPCVSLKKDLIDLQGFDSKIICILDFDSNKKDVKLFRVKNVPTSIIIDIDEKEIARLSGYDKDSYQKWLQNF